MGRGVVHSRSIALVYYLTRDGWAAEHGGVLRDLETGEEHVPSFNTLIAFR